MITSYFKPMFQYLKTFFIILICLINTGMLIKSMRTYYKKDGKKRCCSMIMFMHYINLLVISLVFIFQIIIQILPILYYMILLSCFAQFLAMRHISRTILTVRNQKELKRRKIYLGIMWFIFVCALGIPWIPVKKIHITCSPGQPYPGCFICLILFLFV